LFYVMNLVRIPLKFGKIQGIFSCAFNRLTSLEGSPKIAVSNFSCNDNDLVDLKGAPQIVGGSFYCFNNKLTSLEGAPKTVGGNFYCCCKSKRFTEEEIRAVCDVKGYAGHLVPLFPL